MVCSGFIFLLGKILVIYIFWYFFHSDFTFTCIINKSVSEILSSFSLLILCICALVIVMLRKGASSIGHLLCLWQPGKIGRDVHLWHWGGNSKQEVVATSGEVILHLCEAARASAWLPEMPMPASCWKCWRHLRPAG